MKKKSKKITSKKITSSKFIYEFDVSHKSLKTKIDKKKHALKIFNQFLTLYIKENTKKDRNYPLLTPTSYILKESNDKKHFFYNIITNPYNNHPFSLFGTYDDKIIYIMIPMGNSIGHFDIRKIKKQIKTLSSIKKLGLYHLLNLSIEIRKESFVKYNKNDIYNCKNILECDKQLKQLKNNKQLTLDLYNKLQIKYSLLVKNSIKNFFNLIKKGKYNIAKDYITKDNVNIDILNNKQSYSKKSKQRTKKNNKSNKSNKFNKSNKIKKNICLKNLLYNSKDLIGHLLIFIEIYKCIDIIKDTI